MGRDNFKKRPKIKKIPKEYAIIWNDIIRILSIYFVIHIIEYYNDNIEFFNKTFIRNIIYLIIGTILYDVIVKKLLILDEEEFMIDY